MNLEKLSKGEQRAFVGISELLDRDPKSREAALLAFEKTVYRRRPDIGRVFFGTLDPHIQTQVRQVCAPHFVVID